MSVSKFLEKWSIGSHLQEECHSRFYTLSVGIKTSNSLTKEQAELISLRTGLEIGPEFTICHHHEQTILMQYGAFQKKCCDPFQKHKNPFNGSLRKVSIASSKSYHKINIYVVPGQKLCPTCRREMSERLKASEGNDDDNVPDVCFPERAWKQQKEDLDITLEDIDVSPIKLHSVPKHSRASYGKRKLDQVKTKLTEKQSNILNVVAETIDVMPDQLMDNEEAESDYCNTERKAKDFDEIISLMKDKIRISERSMKIKILTLASSSWSVQKVMEEFGVTEYMVRQARDVALQKGILELPTRKKVRLYQMMCRRR